MRQILIVKNYYNIGPCNATVELIKARCQLHWDLKLTMTILIGLKTPCIIDLASLWLQYRIEQLLLLL